MSVLKQIGPEARRISYRKLSAVVVSDVIYILLALATGLRHKEELQRLPYFMLVVFFVNVFIWQFGGSPRAGRVQGWRRTVRFCIWCVVVVSIPMIALDSLEQMDASHIVSMIAAFSVSFIAMWFSTSGVGE